jgi:hypothetical protein
MEELLTLIAAGSLIPVISFIVKKLIVDKAFEFMKDEISIKDKNGKEIKFIASTGISNEEIKIIFESELKFEAEVQKSINKFIHVHNKFDLKLSHGKYIDFLLSYDDKKIGIEAKSNVARFKAKWISDYFKENSEIDELIMIIDSRIPESFLKEVDRFDYSKKVKFISSPRGKGLAKSISNVLEADLGLKKALQRTSR